MILSLQKLKKFERGFFGQVALDRKSVFTFEKQPLVEDLKLKISKNPQIFTFSKIKVAHFHVISSERSP